ncbi:MAG: YHYH protein [Byssovorax sp.]
MLTGCGSTDPTNGEPESPTVTPGDPPTYLRTPATGTDINKPAKNTLYFCPRAPLKAYPPLTRPSTPWVNGEAVDISKIPIVEGSETRTSEFAMTMTDAGRHLKGNGIPNHPIGTFPVQEGTAAYEYYAAIPVMTYGTSADIPVDSYDLDITLPKNPTPNETPACIKWIPTGVVTQTGAMWHLDFAFDAQKHLLDPVAALPMDLCWGHPYEKQYHYHGYSWKCFPNQGDAKDHSPLFGYAIDGFGVFGPRGEGGKLVSNDDLDECHGHTHMIAWDGEMKEMYHYHVNNEYPYSIGCFRGTPIELPEQLQH